MEPLPPAMEVNISLKLISFIFNSLHSAPEASYGAPAPSYGAPEPSYAAPAPAYGAPSYAAQRYYVRPSALWRPLTIYLLIFQDPYAANAASGLGAEVYSPELNPYSIQEEAAAVAGGRKWEEF